MKSYTLLAPPASEPVSLADVKTFLRIDGNNDDAVLTTLIASARRMAEEYTKRAFITQTWLLTMDGFTSDSSVPLPPYLPMKSVQLSRLPLQSVTSIVTTNSANTNSTLSAATYTVDTASGSILLNDGYSWPTDLRPRSGIAITFVAGWTNAAAVPDPIKQGILQHVAASYSNKVCADIPAGSKSLYDGFRLPEVFGAY